MSAIISISTPFFFPIGFSEKDYEGIILANMCFAAIMDQEEYDNLCKINGIEPSDSLKIQMDNMVKKGKVSKITDNVGNSDYFFTPEQVRSWVVDEVMPALGTGLLITSKIRHM